MSDSTSNQGKAVVTNGTAHVAQNPGTIDVCFNPAVSPQVKPFQNYIPSTDLKAGKTENTLIADKNIMTARTFIGPDSAGDEDPYTIGFVSAHPYNNWAKADSWSHDVKAEGFYIIRTDDVTQQNARNSYGTMDGSKLDGDETTVREYAVAKCTMNKLEGTSGKRHLYKKSATATKEDYIEILTGETVEFVSERIDATDITGDPPKDPACALVPDHTIWRILRTGAEVERKFEQESGKTYTLDGGFTNIGGASWELSLSTPRGETQTLDKGATRHGVRETTQGPVTDGITVDVGALLAFLRFRRNPCNIRVDALACAGPKTAWVRLFPKEKVKATFSLGAESEDSTSVGASGRNDFLDALYRRLGFARRLCNTIARIVGLAGDIEFGFKLFEGFSLEIELEYKHCEKTLTTRAGDWRSDKAHVGLAYLFKVSSAPLIEFSIRVAIPVVAIAAAFFTGPGASVVVRVLRKIEDIVGDNGFRFDLVFRAAISVGMNYEFTIDQHVEGDFTGQMEIKPTLTIMLELVLLKAEARAGGTLEGTVTVGTALPPPTHFMRLVSSGKLEFKVWVEGKVSGRVLWIGPRYEFSGRREFKVFEWQAWQGRKDVIEIGRRATS